MTTPALQTVLYWFTLAAVTLSAAAGVLEAGRKRFDLFGMLVIAFTAALGGGTLRDLLLDRPVFWVANQTWLWVTLLAGMVTFFLARWVRLSPNLFLIPDAAALALYAVAGTHIALGLHAPWLVASLMGVITGVMGGVLRDVLCNVEPLVFQGTLYATAAWLGTLVLIAGLEAGLDLTLVSLCSGGLIFALRVAAIRWGLGLPTFRSK